jgi:long-chain acyl-CoA synthetase
MAENRRPTPARPRPPATRGAAIDGDALAAFLQRHTGVGRVEPSTTLGSLGLDSLGVMELLSALDAELGLDSSHFLADETTTVEELAAQAGGRLPPPGPRYRAGRWPLTRPVVALRALFQLLLFQPLLAVLSRRRVRGLEHLRGLPGPVIFAANHLSLLDNPAVMVALPWRWRLRLATAASDHVLDQRGQVQRFIAILLCNAFPLSQTRSVRRSMQFCRWLVAGGWSLLYFPEGRRSEDGSILRFKRGIGLLAVELGLPVVPVHLKGIDRVMPMGARWPRRGTIEISFGQPLRFARDDEYASAADAIREAIAILAREADR